MIIFALNFILLEEEDLASETNGDIQEKVTAWPWSPYRRAKGTTTHGENGL